MSLNHEERVSRFEKQVRSVGGQVVLLPDLMAVQTYVTDLAITLNSRRIAVSRKLPRLFPPHMERGELEIADESMMGRAEFFDSLKLAEIGVSQADLAVSETGTLLMATSDEIDRLVTALPRTHVAVLPSSRLVNSLSDAAAYVTGILNERNAIGTISLISGISSTADIGGMVVLGVHGPKFLHICLLDQDLKESA